MNIVQTALVFAGIPLAIIAFFFAVIYGPAEIKHGARYRPGRAWTHAPLWYLPHPVNGGAAEKPHAQTAIEGATDHPVEEPVSVEAVGGASGEW